MASQALRKPRADIVACGRSQWAAKILSISPNGISNDEAGVTWRKIDEGMKNMRRNAKKEVGIARGLEASIESLKWEREKHNI